MTSRLQFLATKDQQNPTMDDVPLSKIDAACVSPLTPKELAKEARPGGSIAK